MIERTVSHNGVKLSIEVLDLGGLPDGYEVKPDEMDGEYVFHDLGASGEPFFAESKDDFLVVTFREINLAPRSTEEKPQIGLKPRKLHEEKRMIDISEAIIRRVTAGETVRIEWINELRDLAETRHKAKAK